MITLLLVGFWFWVFMIAAFVALVWAMEEDHYWWATTVFVSFFVILALFGSFNAFKWIASHPALFAMGLAVYVAGGIIYVFPKWGLYLKTLGTKLGDIQQKFLDAEKITASQMTQEYIDKWKHNYDRSTFVTSIGNTDTHSDEDLIPLARRHKASITGWMMYWPASFVATFVTDFLAELWNTIYGLIQDRLQAMSNHMFRDAGFRVPPPSMPGFSVPTTPTEKQ